MPGGASPPAVTADRIRIAEQTGAQAVQMARDGLTIDKVLTPAAFENAMRVLLAIGGSTNGIVHLTAIAGRMGLDIDLAALDRMGRETPVLLDLKPSGQHYMEDFHKAGGMATLLRELKPLLRLDAMTVTGRTLGEELERAGPGFKQDVVRTIADPIYPQGGIAVLRGNLAPGGAIIKQSAADAKLMEHEGRAVVFENIEDLVNRIDSDDLDVTPQDVLVLKNIGPKGAPGMPEAGYIPIPRKLARAGVQGHRAHLRWAHERHRLRHHRAARHARVSHRRAAGLCAQRRPHPAERVRSARSRLLVSDEELARRAQGVARGRADRRTRLPQAVPADGDAGRPRRRLRLPACAEDRRQGTALISSGQEGPSRAAAAGLRSRA